MEIDYNEFRTDTLMEIRYRLKERLDTPSGNGFIGFDYRKYETAYSITLKAYHRVCAVLRARGQEVY